MPSELFVGGSLERIYGVIVLLLAIRELQVQMSRARGVDFHERCGALKCDSDGHDRIVTQFIGAADAAPWDSTISRPRGVIGTHRGVWTRIFFCLISGFD